MEGWKTVIHKDWTHYNARDRRHTNIDIIIYRNFDENVPSIQFLDFNRQLSDHIPIQVTIKNLAAFRKKVDNSMYVDKKAIYEHNIELL